LLDWYWQNVVRFYFDHNATTPISREVLEQYLPTLLEVFGNASSIHQHGQAAKQKLEEARSRAARLIGCQRREVVWVSGGTEANNLAILGAVRALSGTSQHVITTAIEHPAVLNPCAQLEREGVDVTYLTVGSSGVVDPDKIRRALRPDTVLISVMHVNNEIGTVQPIREIAEIAREAEVLMHCDGVQALGRIPVNVGELGVDLYSASGHKMYGPKGVGLLYVRNGTPLTPLLYGGRHEQERRAGTENVPGVVGMGAAAEWIHHNLPLETQRLRSLRDRLEAGILQHVADVTMNGAGAPRAANTTNVCFDGVEGESLVIGLDLKGFAVSSGSACSSGAVEPSHVLTAIGLTREQAKSSIRFSLGRENDEAQVDALVNAIVETVGHLRKLSPTYSGGFSFQA
jgi:cysteine desulfurase